MDCLAGMLDQEYPQFNTVAPQHLLTDALYQMCCENVEFLIVLEDDRFTGVVSEHDITQKLLFADKPLHELTVGEIMNRHLPVANTTDTVSYAMQLLDRYNSRYLAVYDSFTFRGVLSESDLLKSVISNQQLTEATGGKVHSWNY